MRMTKKEREKANLPTTFDQATFTLNSANSNVAAKASTSALPVASGSTCRLWKETRAESPSDSGSVEVVIVDETPSHARACQGGLESSHACDDGAWIAAQEGETTQYLHTDDQSSQKTTTRGPATRSLRRARTRGL